MKDQTGNLDYCWTATATVEMKLSDIGLLLLSCHFYICLDFQKNKLNWEKVVNILSSAEGQPLTVYFKLPVSEISEIDDHKSVSSYNFKKIDDHKSVSS